MKRCIADGSVGFPHVRVGHRQAFILRTPIGLPGWGFFMFMDGRYPRNAGAISRVPLLQPAFYMRGDCGVEFCSFVATRKCYALPPM